MADEFRRDVALFLTDVARAGRTVTYGDVALRFGGIARGYGPCLTAIAERLYKHGHPLLPVLVVSADTGLPSLGAEIYRRLGLQDEEAIRAEQQKCFACDWAAVFPPSREAPAKPQR
ncbi:hypothetical protein LMIY3S_01793 [Labrys miyagiensis]